MITQAMQSQRILELIRENSDRKCEALKQQGEQLKFNNSMGLLGAAIGIHAAALTVMIVGGLGSCEKIHREAECQNRTMARR